MSTQKYDDGLPYTTLSYANGPAYYYHNIATGDGNVTRRQLNDTLDPALGTFDFAPTSAGPREFESHGGDDVAIFAQGPMAHMFHTTHENIYIGHVMAFAACIGPYADDPDRCTGGGNSAN